ncbi:cytochrome P450 [Novosphingobium sp. G106]|uniref:cytochrome P450 n=1 Tax=Novosphingobium sp. G106 TaxID=2849500 RepID=UPI001C2D3EEB|nr:cytochrome P450 [Novosphingobium sp. G106]MBV1687490.1 cytochrome P450 [Novosphingobium sp. G106]
MSEAATMSALVPQPAHVPDALVYDFDMYHEPAMERDAPARLLEIAREAPPVFWTPHNGGHWVVKSYPAIMKAARDWENFSSEHIPREEAEALLANLPAGTVIVQPVPILLDPPDHTRFRLPLQPVFSPKAMMKLQAHIRELAIELVEGVKQQGHCEFVSAIGERIPTQVFLEIFGLPLERQDDFRKLVEEHLSDDFGTLDNSQRKLRRMADIMHDTLVERRENPRDDLISVLWQSTVDGRPLTLEDMQNYCVLLFIAGLDTVMNGMGHGVRHLAMHPELQAQLRANPRLIVEANEELLRRYGFVAVIRRAARDFECEGAQLKRGERVSLSYPMANLDPAEFADPGRFDLGRENKVHLTFGGGPHRCVGSHLARIELQTLYEEMLARLPAFRLDPDRPVRYRCGPVTGPREIHLLWDN